MQVRYNDFREVLQIAKQHGGMSEKAKMIYLGRLSYAVESGDLTTQEGESLMEEMEPGIRERNMEEMQVAAFGDTDAQRRLTKVA